MAESEGFFGNHDQIAYRARFLGLQLSLARSRLQHFSRSTPRTSDSRLMNEATLVERS